METVSIDDALIAYRAIVAGSSGKKVRYPLWVAEILSEDIYRRRYRMPITRIGDIDMYYEVHGTGEPLVLLHGLSLDSSVWIKQVSSLSQKYQVIIFDNRGVGQTDDPHNDYSTEMMADDTATLMKFLNVAAAHILGFSMGGMIAQIIALKYPELAKSLLLTATATRLPARGRHLIQLWLRMLNEKVPL
jgi:3-oxoadipate enol-lactonase